MRGAASAFGPPPLWGRAGTPAVLEDTRVGRMPGRVFLAGGPDVDENDLREVELWAPEKEGAGRSGVSEEEEGGPGPPL